MWIDASLGRGQHAKTFSSPSLRLKPSKRAFLPEFRFASLTERVPGALVAAGLCADGHEREAVLQGRQLIVGCPDLLIHVPTHPQGAVSQEENPRRRRRNGLAGKHAVVLIDVRCCQ